MERFPADNSMLQQVFLYSSKGRWALLDISACTYLRPCITCSQTHRCCLLEIRAAWTGSNQTVLWRLGIPCNVDMYSKKHLMSIWWGRSIDSMVSHRWQKQMTFNLCDFTGLVGTDPHRDPHHCHCTRKTRNLKGRLKNNRQNCFCVT